MRETRFLLLACLVTLGFGAGCGDGGRREHEGDEPGECSDDIDNDHDGLFDCDDDGCAGSPSCVTGDGDADSDHDADVDSEPDADSAGDADHDERSDAAPDADDSSDADQDAETPCAPDTYPCGPYGYEQCDVVPDLGFIPGNSSAWALAGEDGQLDLHDLIRDPDTVGILIAGVNGWDTFSASWMTVLPTLHDEFGVTADGRIEFVVAVMTDDIARPASGEYAAYYAGRHSIDFPVVADPYLNVMAFVDLPSSPVTLLIDATTMRLLDVVVGVNTEAVRTVLSQMDGTVHCPPE